MIKTVATTVLCAASAFAQSQSEQEEKMKAELRDRLFFISAEGLAESTVAGMPYSADETNTTTQMLFDGNRIVRGSTTKVYRDQQGRTRIERTLSNIGTLPAAQPAVRIEINDPVANIMYTLEPESKVAYKAPAQRSSGSADFVAVQAKLKQLAEDLAKARAEKESVSATANRVSKQERGSKREDLGNSNMAGVAVKGTRTTTVILAGTVGNDRDINIVDEKWYSPDLKMNIMTRHSDPRSGETVFQVSNLTRANPDPSLFQVPSDYQIKESAQKLFKFTKE